MLRKFHHHNAGLCCCPPPSLTHAHPAQNARARNLRQSEKSFRAGNIASPLNPFSFDPCYVYSENTRRISSLSVLLARSQLDLPSSSSSSRQTTNFCVVCILLRAESTKSSSPLVVVAEAIQFRGTSLLATNILLLLQFSRNHAHGS